MLNASNIHTPSPIGAPPEVEPPTGPEDTKSGFGGGGGGCENTMDPVEININKASVASSFFITQINLI